MMQQVYKDKLWVGILSYGLATGVGLSRVYDNVHWSSDVLVGAALGFAIGQSVYKLMIKESKLQMGLSENGGISLVYKIK
jgi:membrane-associated phospholipid phosphatase